MVEVGWRRAAVYVVCRDPEARLLLTRFSSAGHPDDGKWTMPGGGMEWGELPQETAVRELEEETGLHAVIGPVVGVFSRWYTDRESALGRAGHVVGIVYAAEDVTGRLRTTFDPGTTDAAQWHSMEQIERLPRVELVDYVLSLL